MYMYVRLTKIENNFKLPEDSVWNDLVARETIESTCLSMMMIESSLGKFLD